jgi:hypothetical protein
MPWKNIIDQHFLVVRYLTASNQTPCLPPHRPIKGGQSLAAPHHTQPDLAFPCSPLNIPHLWAPITHHHSSSHATTGDHRLGMLSIPEPPRWRPESGDRHTCHTRFWDQNQMLIVCMPKIKLSYIRLECKYRKPMSLLYCILLQVQKGLNNRMDTILPQADDWGFHMPRRALHQRTPHLLSSRA